MTGVVVSMTTLDDPVIKRPPTLLPRMPDTPLFVAGTLGGPFVIYLLTPLRNALTLASQDRHSSMTNIYKQVFSRGFSGGWIGGKYPTLPAIPQFVILGPMYHFYSSLTNPYAALFLTGVTETMFTFGANSRNAEVAFNTQAPAARQINHFTKPWQFWGPGSVAHAGRNTIAMGGMRILSDPVYSWMSVHTPLWSPVATKTLADFTASMMTGALSMPFNQLFNYYATSIEARTLSLRDRVTMGLTFLRSQYLRRNDQGKLRLSPIMLRDLVMRSVYASCLFGIYVTIERSLVRNWINVTKLID